MPQREFWTDRVPCSFAVDYVVNPLKPEDDPSLLVVVKDQAGEWMDFASIPIPLGHIEVAVKESMEAAFAAYLYGEIGDVRTTMRSVTRRWRLQGLYAAS